MSLTPQFHWTFKLKGGRKFHLAASDEYGAPYASTLCGKTYEPDDRLKATKGIQSLPELIVQNIMCSGCAKQMISTFAMLRNIFVQAGDSDEEAIAKADQLVKWKRDFSK